jgi:ribosomal protein S18 acetylase RimI-like enzyme
MEAARGGDAAEVLDQFSVPLPVRIRPWEERDLAALEWNGLQSAFRLNFRAMFERAEKGEVLLLVAEVKGYPVARLGVDLARKPGVAYLWSFSVLPRLRGLGIGARLLLVAQELARTRGFEQAEIAVTNGNPSARRLYEHLGFEVVGTERNTYAYTRPDGGHDSVVEECLLLRKDLGSLPQGPAEPGEAAPAPPLGPPVEAPGDRLRPAEPEQGRPAR